MFGSDQLFKSKRLLNHVIRVADVMNQDFCPTLCFMEPNCVSYNFKKPTIQTGDHKCELNNSTHEEHENDTEENPDYLYRGAKVRFHAVFISFRLSMIETLPANSHALSVILTPADRKLRSHANSRLRSSFSRLT